MSSTILTNRVELKVNPELVNSAFDIWLLKTDLVGKANYGPVINTIYRELKPLSLAFVGTGSYAVLLPKGAIISFNNPHYSLNRLKANDLSTVSCARLLINAMPNLSDSQSRYSEGAGLYYLADIEKIGRTEVLRAFEIRFSQTGNNVLLNVNGATFTPVQYHTNAKGELYGDCTHLPRFRFDKWSQEIGRARCGEFIKKKHRDRKMKSDMVSLDTKYPGKFWKTKMGILAQFIQDVERELGDMLRMEFLPLSSSYRVRFKDTDVKKVYSKIDALLAGYLVNVVNLTDANTTPLEKELISDGISCEQSGTVKSDALNLVIHYPAEHYEALGQEDPYRSLRSDPRTIVQSVYPTTLFTNDGIARSPYEACKKELLIKIEVNENTLHLVKPEGHWTFIRSVTVYEPNNSTYYHVLRLQAGAMSYCQLDQGSAEELLLNLPGALSQNGYAVINETRGEGFIFEETGMVAIPEFQSLSAIMSELERGFDNGLPRDWIIEFLGLLENEEIEVKNAELVSDKLTRLLEATVGKERITKEVLLANKETKLSYRGSLQTFFDWVTVEKGLRFGASLKSQNAGLLEAALGLFYNDEEHLYFVGDKDNVKSIPRFCQIRRILTDTNEVPEGLLKMMEVFHIRHKQATVYPFLFKHLSEYEERAKIKT
ncbi:MAG: hypothetical protein K9L79_15960 [Methylobacter tundripaludum]|nr:hypothetical protein [Methylobacter tundripaludum]